MDPHFLGPLVRTLQDEPKAGLAVARIFFHNRPDEVWFGGGTWAFNSESIRRGLPAWHEHGPAQEAATEPYPTGYATGCAVLVRAELMRELGGFDERYFAYCEDIDLCLRGRKRGWVCVVVPASQIWHKVGRSTGGELSPESLYYGVRNYRLLLLTHGTPGQKALGTMRYLRIYLPQLLSPDQDRLEAVLQALWCAGTKHWGARVAHNDIRPACARLAHRLRRLSRWHWKLNGLRQRWRAGRPSRN